MKNVFIINISSIYLLYTSEQTPSAVKGLKVWLKAPAEI